MTVEKGRMFGGVKACWRGLPAARHKEAPEKMMGEYFQRVAPGKEGENAKWYGCEAAR
jgi:hypothetical protein